MDRPGRYGSGDIFGTQENFERHQITRLLEQRATELRGHERLILLGFGNFRRDHETVHDILVDLKIPHTYQNGPKREHRWESGWSPEAVKALLQGEGTGR
jgi:hypothetical protein